MRAFAGLLVACALLFGVYQYYLRTMPKTDEGTAPTQAISLVGVRAALLQVAEAERAYVALNGKCGSLEELLAASSFPLSRPEGDGYSFSIECSGEEFTVTARHDPAPANSPIRYPTLAIDQTMEVHEVN
jgi:hypothetical protein